MSENTDWLKERGLCLKCKGKLSAEDKENGYVNCQGCRAAIQERQKKLHEQFKKQWQEICRKSKARRYM